MTQVQQRWRDMPPARRGAVITVAAVDIGLRIWALADLATRPSEQVRGPKALWVFGLTTVSSAGILPTTYLLVGRRRD